MKVKPKNEDKLISSTNKRNKIAPNLIVSKHYKYTHIPSGGGALTIYTKLFKGACKTKGSYFQTLFGTGVFHQGFQIYLSGKGFVPLWIVVAKRDKKRRIINYKITM